MQPRLRSRGYPLAGRREHVLAAALQCGHGFEAVGMLRRLSTKPSGRRAFNAATASKPWVCEGRRRAEEKQGQPSMRPRLRSRGYFARFAKRGIVGRTPSMRPRLRSRGYSNLLRTRSPGARPFNAAFTACSKPVRYRIRALARLIFMRPPSMRPRLRSRGYVRYMFCERTAEAVDPLHRGPGFEAVGMPVGPHHQERLLRPFNAATASKPWVCSGEPPRTSPR